MLPELHNTRAEQQWQIVSAGIDFTDQVVIDLGCGRGDLAMRIAAAGAKKVVCLDRDLTIVQELKEKNGFKNLHIVQDDILTFIERDMGKYDTAICFSVIPYLGQVGYNRTLEWMQWRSLMSLIECQYRGDGPGLAFLRNDHDMQSWLYSFGWSQVARLGKTDVEIRNTYRSIWGCW